MTYETILSALADPTRRTVLERLRARPSDVEGLAATLPVSRPAVSQHLRVLADAGLVEAEARGTRRVYRLRPDGLDALRRYLDTFWDEVLTAYGADEIVDVESANDRDVVDEDVAVDIEPEGKHEGASDG